MEGSVGSDYLSKQKGYETKIIILWYTQTDLFMDKSKKGELCSLIHPKGVP